MEVGSRYLSGLIRDYKGDLELALAAYNAGPARGGHGTAACRPTAETAATSAKVSSLVTTEYTPRRAASGIAPG